VLLADREQLAANQRVLQARARPPEPSCWPWAASRSLRVRARSSRPLAPRACRGPGEAVKSHMTEAIVKHSHAGRQPAFAQAKGKLASP